MGGQPCLQHETFLTLSLRDKVLVLEQVGEVSAVLEAACLLVGSNVFMTFAWYAHLRNLRARPLIVAILASWAIALFEYTLQVPANRIGYDTLSLGQLKVMQEAITLVVFVPFVVLYMPSVLRNS